VRTDVIIIGGGLMGLSTALHLGRRETRCLVLEKDSPARHASGVNAGGLRRLNRDPAEIPLSVAAAEMWRDISSLVDSDCDVRLSVQVRVAENPSDLEMLETRAASIRALGYDHEEMIGRDELYRLVPALAPHCVGALACRGDGFARPFHAATAFRHKAQQLGAEIRTDCQVTKVESNGRLWRVVSTQGVFEAPVLVNAAGAWAGDIAASLDEPVPLKAGAPMMMVTARVPRFLDAVVGAASRKLSFKQMQNGSVVIGGAHLAEHDMQRETTRIDMAKLKTSAQTVMALFPHMADAPIVRTWAGLEAFTPDKLPVIGASSRHPGLYHAFGFSAHGFQLSPAVGRVMSELILDGQPGLPLEDFRIDRFFDANSPG
jgi:sarcosine oxidase subunit beta